MSYERKEKEKLFLFCFRSVFILVCDVHVGTSGKTRVVKQEGLTRDIM